MHNEKVLKSALWYRERGLSVIPILHPKADRNGKDENKKPKIEWGEYQEKIASEEEIKKWFSDKRNTRLAIVTGKFSGISVLDCDSEETHQQIEELFPDSLITPKAATPGGGFHYYFKYHPIIPQKSNIIPKLDGRNDGGYIIAPPSSGLDGKDYKWIISPANANFCDLPHSIIELLSNLSNTYNKNIYKGVVDTENYASPQLSTLSTTVHNLFREGRRDEDLFHLANCLIKGGMHEQEAELFLKLIATKVCFPPYPESDVPVKIQSAIKRQNTRTQSLIDDVRDFILSTSGHFLSTEVYNCLQVSTRKERKAISTYLSRMVDEGTIERVGEKNGVFRKVKETEYENWWDADAETIDFRLPFDMEKYANVYPGDIIVLAGSKSTGKTALALEIIRLNMDRFEAYYHSSELVPQTFKLRISKSERTPIEKWKKVKMSSGLSLSDAHDRVIKDGLNVFDYLESDEGEDYKIVGTMAKIHRALKSGIAVICLQKRSTAKFAAGGEGTKNKANIYLTLDDEYPRHICRIAECKTFKNNENPKGYMIDYKIYNGINLLSDGYWQPEIEAKYKGLVK